MRFARVMPLILALSLLAVLAVPAAAAPDPSKNRNAIVLTLECESGEVLITTIAHNQAVAVSVVGGGTAVIMWADGYDVEDPGTPLFSFGNKGFAKAGLETETCISADNPNTPGFFAVMEVFFTP